MRATSPGPPYGKGGIAVGKFDATRAGNYRVSVATGITTQGAFAVGDGFAVWMRLSEWGALAVLVIAGGSAIAIIVVPAIHRRRHQAA